MQTATIEDAYVRYRRDLYRFLLQRTGSHSDAEELTQQVFADAASSISGSDPPRSMRGWLYTVAERRLVDELRRRTRAAEVARALAAERPREGETAGEVGEAVGRLPLVQRRLVFMRVIEERPYREIARELGCNEAACKMRLSRALRRLRNELVTAS